MDIFPRNTFFPKASKAMVANWATLANSAGQSFQHFWRQRFFIAVILMPVASCTCPANDSVYTTFFVPNVN